jgi:capsular exopolysaccharide synthesis family protein
MTIAASPRPSVPHAPAGQDRRAGGIAEQLVSLVAPGSVAADQYRTLRYSIESLRKESGLHVIAVTSPTPGDGKTVTTLNLAGSLAQADGARVLVIDADLRKPSVARYLALDGLRSPGLSDALRDPRYELHQIVRHLKGFNLWVAPAGPPELSPYELLSSTRFDALLREARREFDCVLVDTPPAVMLPDCRLIARAVDGFVMIVAAHKTPRKLVAEALTELTAAKILGVVFNADDNPTSSYYGYYGYGR